MKRSIILKKIKLIADKQKQQKISANQHLKERLFHKYSLSVIEKLRNIFIDNERPEAIVVNACKQFLRNNWNTVKNSSLTYTATAQTEVTQLLCDVALYISSATVNSAHKDSNRPKGALEYLMPGLQTESHHEAKPDLHPQWQEKEKRWIDVNPKEIIATHIISDTGTHLIPISLLCDCNDLSEKLFDYYFQPKEKANNNGYLSPKECERLYSHSSITKEWFKAIKDVETISSKKYHLLGLLKALIKQLEINSKYFLGSEDTAGEDVYQALVAFNEFYRQCDKKQIESLPESLSNAINNIITTASNKKHVGTAKSCVELRGADLKKAIEGNEVLLSSISPTKKVKSELLSNAKATFLKAKSTLTHSLENHEYKLGMDQQNISYQLLKKYKVTIKLANFEDIKLLFELNTEELEEICTDEKTQLSIIVSLSTLENLITLCLDLSPKKIERIFGLLSEKIVQNIIQFPTDLRAVLTILNPDKCLSICKALKKQMHKVIPDRSQAYILYKGLESKKLNIFLRNFENLHSYIKSAEDFEDIARCLSEENISWLYNKIKRKLLEKTIHVRDFLTVNKCLTNKDAKNDWFKLHEKNLINIVTKSKLPAFYFFQISKTLDSDKFEKLCKRYLNITVMQKLAESIVTFKGFGRIYNRLPTIKMRLDWYKCNETKLIKFAKSGQDFIQIFNILGKAENSHEICDKFFDKVPKDFMRYMDKGKFIHLLSPKKAAIATSKDFLNSGDMINFTLLLNALPSPEYKLAFYNHVESRLPGLCKNTSDISICLKPMNYEQIRKFFNNFNKEKLKKIISDNGLYTIFRYLNINQATTVCESITDTLALGVIKLTSSFSDLKKSNDFYRYTLDELTVELRERWNKYSESDIKIIIRYVFISIFTYYKNTREKEDEKYLKGKFGIFQQSKAEKLHAVNDLLSILQRKPGARNINLKRHKKALKNGRLGEIIKILTNSSTTNSLFNLKIESIDGFIDALTLMQQTIKPSTYKTPKKLQNKQIKEKILLEDDTLSDEMEKERIIPQKEEANMAEQLAAAVSTALSNYKQFHKKVNDSRMFFSKSISDPRGKAGFFSRFRHSRSGIDNAEKLHGKVSRDPDKSEQIINDFLNKNSTHFHRHSFSSYLLDEIRGLENSPWSDIAPDDNNKYNKLSERGRIRMPMGNFLLKKFLTPL